MVRKFEVPEGKELRVTHLSDKLIRITVGEKSNWLSWSSWNRDLQRLMEWASAKSRKLKLSTKMYMFLRSLTLVQHFCLVQLYHSSRGTDKGCLRLQRQSCPNLFKHSQTGLVSSLFYYSSYKQSVTALQSRMVSRVLVYEFVEVCLMD